MEAKLQFNKTYFSECFEQSIRYASKRYLIGRILGVVFLIAGALWTLESNGAMATPIALLFFGTFELFSPLLKRVWLTRRQMKSPKANMTVTFMFDDEGIVSKSPYSEGKFKWEGVERILETPKGVLIWPQKGIHIYLPKVHVEPEIVHFILSKAV